MNNYNCLTNPNYLWSKFALAILVDGKFQYKELHSTNKLNACVESAFYLSDKKVEEAHILMRTYPHEYKSIYRFNLIRENVVETGFGWN